ncbi:MAG: hypothetical protein K0S51_412 [Bacillales bacterium]|jgi:uncharacterized protein YqhQ|nr:hypothetical protein [Bacillales bacterium]
MSEKRPVYGGQAVIEGIMFGGRKHTVTAVRKKDKTFEYFQLEKSTNKWLLKLKKIPLIRGLVGIFESAAIGSRHMNFSAEVYEEETDENKDNVPEVVVEEKEPSKLLFTLSIAVIGILSFLAGKFIFTIIPVFIADFFSPIFPSKIGQIILEGTFKFLILLLYLYAISFTPMIRRVFQYHGAEHKLINTYEAGLNLTVENIKMQSRLHYRCGSSFILFTILVSFVVYMFVPIEPLWVRLLNRILLIPVVLGISFELLQISNSVRSLPVLRFLGYPGLWLQLLTTKEPTNDQIEVAIASFNKLIEIEKNDNNIIKA